MINTFNRIEIKNLNFILINNPIFIKYGNYGYKFIKNSQSFQVILNNLSFLNLDM
jgi:hypothetical protein